MSFAVIDLANISVPISEESQIQFAFTFEGVKHIDMAPNGIFKQYCNCTDLCSWDLDKLQLENCIFEALF